MEWLADTLRGNPELAFFLALGGGYLVGRIRLGSQPLGTVLGVLLVGLAVGQIGITIADEVKWILFYFFLFAIGFKCGPQFVQGLRSSGAIQVGLTFLFAIAAMASVYLSVRVFGFDAGTGAGMFAGALTASSALGVAGDAIARLPLPDVQRRVMQANLTTAFAASYFIGVIVTTWFLSRVGPWIMRVNLAEECRKLESEMGVMQTDTQRVSVYREFVIRGYRMTAALAGSTVANLEGMFSGGRVFVERIRSGGQIFEPGPALVLNEGDTVALSGRDEILVNDSNPLRQSEISDRELIDIPSQTAAVTLTNRAFAGRELGDIAREAGARGVFLARLERAGQELPRSLSTTVQKGDRLTISGRANAVERMGGLLGSIERPTIATNMIAVSFTIVLGGLIGIPALHLGGMELGLSLSVGILVGGLILGWLHSTTRKVAGISDQVLWLFDSVGLTGFVAVTALCAGPQFLISMKESGLALLVSSISVTILPHVMTLLVGRYLLKVHPGVLLGICAGAGTSAPGLAAVQEAAQSKVPTLGYGVTYALGNILLALGGSVIVSLLAA
jgi:putative transport protein